MSHILLIYGGGVGYSEMMNLPLPEFVRLRNQAVRINRELARKVDA